MPRRPLPMPLEAITGEVEVAIDAGEAVSVLLVVEASLSDEVAHGGLEACSETGEDAAKPGAPLTYALDLADDGRLGGCGSEAAFGSGLRLKAALPGGGGRGELGSGGRGGKSRSPTTTTGELPRPRERRLNVVAVLGMLGE